MKTFFFFIALTFTSIVYSQGNLQFNQVLTFKGSLNGFDCKVSSIIGTVPVSKVWKIEFIGGSRSSNSNYNDGIVINGLWTVINVNSSLRTFPIWLKEGDNIAYFGCGPTLTGGTGNTTTSTSYLISIIEFNIIP